MTSVRTVSARSFTAGATVPEMYLAAASNAPASAAPAFSACGAILSAHAVTVPNEPVMRGMMPETNFSPTRENAARVFAQAPRAVLPDWRAAPPMPRSIAFWKRSKSISPLEDILPTSAAETPISSASSLRIGMPRSPSCAITSPWILPVPATLLKIDPMSVIDVPAIVEASATSLRVRVRSSPGFTPAATVEAATVAASPRPNAVPFTDARAESMIFWTLLVECPSPVSFACASSMFSAREMPPLSARPATAAVIVATAAVPILRPLPRPAPRLLPDRAPVRVASASTFPKALWTSLVSPRVLALSDMYAVASSTAIGWFSLNGDRPQGRGSARSGAVLRGCVGIGSRAWSPRGDPPRAAFRGWGRGRRR